MRTRHGYTGRRRASHAMSETPVEIDGMDVLFDKRVTLFPVTLVERPRKAGRAGYARPEPGGDGHASGRGQGHGNGNGHDEGHGDGHGDGHSHAHGRRRR
jgi:hypothetical protein